MNPLIILIVYLPSMTAVVGATVCAVNHVEGWGWFLFAALCLACVSFKTKEGDEAE